MEKILIAPQDIERIAGQKPDNISNARNYFGSAVLKNSTHIAATEISKEIGNIPVVSRGDTGVRPMRGLSTTEITPMAIEIDDTLSAVNMDTFERSTALGKQQIVDDIVGGHFDNVRETINALCCQAHTGKIDYMMKAGGSLVRYKVDYGNITKAETKKMLSKLTIGSAINALASIKNKCRVGGGGEFIAAENVYGAFITMLTTAKQDASIRDGFVMIGQFKVLLDNDSYVDVSSDGVKTVKTMLKPGEILYRSTNGGQKLLYLRLDDVIQRQAVPFYSFTKERGDQRGVDIYSRSKPFPLINIKAIVLGSFILDTFAVNFTATAGGSVKAFCAGTEIASGDKIASGETIALYATPNESYAFDSWAETDGSAVEGDKNPYGLYVDGAKTVQAKFVSA